MNYSLDKKEVCGRFMCTDGVQKNKLTFRLVTGIN
jgi:hypothetical protein